MRKQMKILLMMAIVITVLAGFYMVKSNPVYATVIGTTRDTEDLEDVLSGIYLSYNGDMIEAEKKAFTASDQIYLEFSKSNAEIIKSNGIATEKLKKLVIIKKQSLIELGFIYGDTRANYGKIYYEFAKNITKATKDYKYYDINKKEAVEIAGKYMAMATKDVYLVHLKGNISSTKQEVKALITESSDFIKEERIK